MKKRLISFVLSITMMFMIFPSLSLAYDSDSADMSYEEYAAHAIQRFIRFSDIDSANADFSMSQPLPVHNDNDNDDKNRAVFLFKDGVCIGEMMITRVDEQYVSSFMQSEFPAITEAAVNETPFSLVTSEESLWFISDTSREIIAGYKNDLSASALQEEDVTYEVQSLTLTPISLPDMEYTIQPLSANYTLNVKLVGNANSPDDGRGLCWAAAMASIIMYRTGRNGITATSLYSNLKSNYGGIPEGTCDWVSRAFSQYSLSYTHRHSGTNYETVKSIIENNRRPIYCWLARTGGGHSVVISGFDSGYGSYFYRILDSNESSPVVVQVPSGASATNFTYAASYGYTYTKWICHMY